MQTHGVLAGSSTRLPGSFLWLGRRDPTEPSARWADDDARHPVAAPFQPGEFCLIHPYQGSACWQVTLRGILLPIASCTDATVRAQFDDLHAALGTAPIRTLDPIVALRDALRAIGPLDGSAHFRAAGAAYLPFTLTDAAYTWLARRFAMVTQFATAPDGWRLRVATTAPVVWDTLEAWTAWLERLPPDPIAAGMLDTLVLGAFIVPNSDGCDGLGPLRPGAWMGT